MTTLKPRSIYRPTIGMSMSDIDGFLQMYHAGELTEHETQILKTILRRQKWTALLNPRYYADITTHSPSNTLPTRNVARG